MRWRYLISWLSLLPPVLSAHADVPVLRVPEGFRIQMLVEALPDARSLALGSRGTLFVGSRRAGTVTALADRDGDGRYEFRRVIHRGRMPNGIDFADGALFVAETERLLRLPGIESRLDHPPAPEILRGDLPAESHHGWRYLRVDSEGCLVVSIGAPCNVCLAPGLARIQRHCPPGWASEVLAAGVRNSVGFDWSPRDGRLWFSDNGRDWLGDDQPPDEINRLDRPGRHFGFPYCHGRDLPDPEFGRGTDCGRFEPPQVLLGAHTAPLGIRFYRGKGFPPRYRNGLFVAQHGSWNRSEKVGYRVLFLPARGSGLGEPEAFIEGWLHDGRVSGRPVDLLEMPDGSLLVSDDYAGRIWRVVYEGAGRSSR